jgi:AcrR family transcriptional regulator
MPEQINKNLTKITSTRTRRALELPRLSRDDWLDSAFKAVVEGGFDNVRVLAMADILGVTRGSFYWHFIDHADLIRSLLARWKLHQFELDQRLQSEATDDARADLEQLLEASLAYAGPDRENIRFEWALRDLGRRDAPAAALVAEVDDARMALFEKKFLRLTGDAKVATELAVLFYLAIAGGHQALMRPANPPQVKEFIKNVIDQYLIQYQVSAKR